MKDTLEMLKPIAVVLLATIGYFQERIFDKDVSAEIFIAIMIASLLLRGNSIWKGIKAIAKSIGGGGVKDPNG